MPPEDGARTKAREYARAWRARNPDYFKKYRENNRDAVMASERASAERNREKRYAAHKVYTKRPEVRGRLDERNAAWRDANPDKVDRAAAKGILSRATGIPHTAIPDELADAKVAQLRLHRAVKDAVGK